MKRLALLLSILFLLGMIFLWGNSQRENSAPEITWWNPADHEFAVVDGRGWPEGLKSPYDRLPARAATVVRPGVWNLSRNSAGLMIRFRTNSSQITIRYMAREAPAFEHMPATGVSGLDLYAINSDGEWLWCHGNYSFGDTIEYRFDGLLPNDPYHQRGREYRLYLPLYNTVEWLEIGVPDNALFMPLPLRPEKPIVVYGTSIAQGACASRPGMAWTAILGRKMDRPLINLGFSGNGQLEKELIELMAEIDAKLYILDCLPNLVRENLFSGEEVKQRILESVRQLREKRPLIPILLTEHAGYSEGPITPVRAASYKRVNRLLREAFSHLKSTGYGEIYLLPSEQINLSMDGTVDGTHPNDLGMMEYAKAYEKMLRMILREPRGNATSTWPCIQYREPDNYDWENRHRDILEMIKEDPPRIAIFANSIINFWGGLPRSPIVTEEESWEKVLTPAGVRNFAYGWDRIENALWRIYHGELDGFQAVQVIILMGTNNLHLNTDQEIVEGLQFLVQAVQQRQAKAEILLMGLLPREDLEGRIAQLNLKIAELAGMENVSYADVGGVFLKNDGRIDHSLFRDGLHPSPKGYRKLLTALQPLLRVQ